MVYSTKSGEEGYRVWHKLQRIKNMMRGQSL